MDKRRITLLAGSHFVNDIYANFLTALLPFLIPSLGLSLPMAGFLVATQQITSSVVQPVLGHLADRVGTRVFSFVGTAAVAVGASSLGVAPGYAFLLALVAMAGLGTASFHPQSAAMVNALTRGRRGTVMSTYLTAGNAGFALSPIIVVPVVLLLGMQGTLLLSVPGLASALLLALYAPKNWLQVAKGDRPPLWRVIASRGSTLARLLGVATFRSVITIGLITFLPLLFQSRGYPPAVWASLMTFLLFSGTAGGFLGGYLSDVIGRRWVIVGSLLLVTPLVLGLLRAEGVMLWAMTGLAGAALMGSFSVLTVRAQELLPENVGMASGLILGFNVGIGGLAMGPAGLLAERLGISETLSLLAFLPLVAALIALTLADQPRVKAGAAATVQGQGA